MKIHTNYLSKSQLDDLLMKRAVLTLQKKINTLRNGKYVNVFDLHLVLPNSYIIELIINKVCFKCSIYPRKTRK